MKAYIRSANSISPQKTFNNAQFLNELVAYHNNRLVCIEPDYNEAIDPKLIRRMSRVIKMSVASALACLQDADIASPDAIITATAYGCLEDTGTFLTNTIEQHEEPITPVAFVQSTHNTIGAQVALIIKCKGYNSTFVSGGASFENALLDAMMLMAEPGTGNVLVGGIDEITDKSHTVLSRLGLYKRNPVLNSALFDTNSKGTINGEGAAFFLLANTPSKNDLACIEAVGIFYKPTDIGEIKAFIKSFMAANSFEPAGIDLLMTGKNGDSKNDKIYNELMQSVFGSKPTVNYKHLCGEYPTSTAFAFWIAANIVNTGTVPAALNPKRKSTGDINKVLIYNHYQNIYHSLILISKL